MKVLHIISSAKWTGAAAPALDLCRALSDCGHDVLFCIGGGRSLEEKARELGVPVWTGLGMAAGPNPLVRSRDVGALAEILSEGGFDVVHAHLSHDHWLAAAAVRRARRAGRRVLLIRSNHHTRPLRSDPWHAHLLRRWTDAVIDVSRRTCLVHQGRLGEDRAFWVHGAVDVGAFRPDVDGGPARGELGVGDGPVAGIIAHLHGDRGHVDLLAAFGEVRRALPAARLLVIGKGSFEPRLRRMVEGTGLSDAVVFPRGFGGRWVELIAALDVSVYLAEGSEGSGRAMLEAMAMGTPVVAADVGVVAETVEDGVTGLVVPRGNRGALAGALLRLLGDEAVRQRMGEAARRTMEAGYTQKQRAEAVASVYESLPTRRKTEKGRE